MTDPKELRALVVKTAPAPWIVTDNRHLNDALWITVGHPSGWEVSIAEVRDGCDEAAELGSMADNAAFIASARSAVPALLDRVEELEKAISAALEEMRSPWPGDGCIKRARDGLRAALKTKDTDHAD
jgi:hypothetical protein